jgi:hypothetical protein
MPVRPTRALTTAPVVIERRPSRLRPLVALTGVLALVVGVMVALRARPSGDARDVTEAAPATQAPRKPNRSPAAPANTARDGSLQLVAKGVHCGDQELGTWPLSRQADGVYCLVDVTASNKSTGKTLVWAASLQAVGSDGAKFRPDDWSWLYHEDSQRLLKPLKPGTTVSGTLVYDVPKGTKFASLVVHDSPLSDGTTLKLR